ncbi:MAG: hypothetical protein DMD49_03650 [Gemmatimonadetes bacterium]|nr:MAG: hypothetical protein DMD49_03650 [Gemmatimonadota bacterium]
MTLETRTLSVIAFTGLIAACGGGTVGIPFIGSVNGAASPAGAVGAQVIISGVSYGDVQGSSQVLFTNSLGGLSVAAPIAQASDWTNTYIITTVPAGAFSGALVVQTGGGTSGGWPFTVSPSVPNVPLTPSAVSWTAGSSLPVAVSGNAAVYARVRTTYGTDTGFVYSIGGADNTGTPTTGVYYAGIGTNGSLEAWKATASLPAALAFHAAVAATPRNSPVNTTGYLYVLGGATNSSGTVYRAALNADGTVGAWTSVGTLPPLHSFGAIIHLGSLYVVGGANNSANTAVATVYRRTIQVDGSLTTPPGTQGPLPAPRARLGIGAYGLYMYAVGGDTATLAPNDATPPNSGVVAVFYGKLNPSSHDIATWTAAGQLETARSAHTAVIAGGNILVTGGLYSGAATGTNEDSYAAIAADGTVGSFSPASGGTKLTSNLFNHAAIGYLSTGSNPTFHLVVVGGDNVNAPGTKSAQSFIY